LAAEGAAYLKGLAGIYVAKIRLAAVPSVGWPPVRHIIDLAT
jgi:hypothetical protein